MKVNFFETEHASEISLTPETVEETAALLRMTNNTKAQKPTIIMGFHDKPYCDIWMKKVEKKENFLTNDK